jgi:hypothetical protein
MVAVGVSVGGRGVGVGKGERGVGGARHDERIAARRIKAADRRWCLFLDFVCLLILIALGPQRFLYPPGLCDVYINLPGSLKRDFPTPGKFILA